jgi:hypothetical protein
MIMKHTLIPAAGATGCTVKSVEAAGENVWKIHLEGRAINTPQEVSLSIAN